MYAMSEVEMAELRAILQTQRWTSHNIKLADDLTTMPGTPDFMDTDMRLAAVRRIIRSRFGDDLSGLRIADLGSLEGGFATALALDGAVVIGIEAREANVAKAELLRRRFKLSNLTFQQADVKAFTAESFGTFDVVLALGIVYHLDRPAAWLRQVAHATGTLLIVDSHFAPANDTELALMRADIRDLSPIEAERVGESSYIGRWYTEFPEDISDAAREHNQWASFSNHRSFWLTEESLLRAMRDAGFDMVAQQHDATIDAYQLNRYEFCRGMYVAQRLGTLQSDAVAQ